MLLCYRLLKKKHILIIFDEIEHISPISSPSKHWVEENDFIFFWQTLRSAYQKYHEVISYLISGTNPQCVEQPTINNTDNPIFQQIPSTYIPAFNVDQTKDMVDTLGRLMGLIFDDIVIARLTDDFGGHPFLIRLVCSKIHSICLTSKRPVCIDKIIYERGKELMLAECRPYIEMILNILQKHYAEEYEMLEMLALGKLDDFEQLSREYPIFIKHLLSYQIIAQNSYGYFFKIEAVKQYLLNTNKYKRKLHTVEDRYHEISERRNLFEKKLRNVIRQILVATEGETQTKNIVLDILSRKKPIYCTYSVKDIFDPNKTELYFDDLRKITLKYWSSFEKIFGPDKNVFDKRMSIINHYRVDCHAKDISEDEFTEFRINMQQLENLIDHYL